MSGDGLPPGWYPDPADPGRHRWWDGERWMEKSLAASPAHRRHLGNGTWTALFWAVGVMLAVTALLFAILAAVVAASFSSYGSNK